MHYGLQVLYSCVVVSFRCFLSFRLDKLVCMHCTYCVPLFACVKPTPGLIRNTPHVGDSRYVFFFYLNQSDYILTLYLLNNFKYIFFSKMFSVGLLEPISLCILYA